MNLLTAKLYDPAGAVSKATSALLAMTAFDTVNLRLAITVPAHGMVRFRLRCLITGATTCPTIFLGVLNGATVVGRVSPQYENATANAATQNFLLDADFIATGLAPGAMNVDAAYGVEVVVAATNIKYGGPNDTTGNNAWGAFCFEAWDPQPQSANSVLAVDASGRVTANVTQVDGAALTAHAAGKVPADVLTVAGTAQTAGDIKASLNTLQADTDDIQARLPAALVGGRMDASVGAMAANVLTAAAINADAITDAKVAADVTIASVTGSVGSVAGNVGGNVVGSVASVTAAVTVGAINANVVNASALAADAVTEIQTGLALSTQVDALEGDTTTLLTRLTATRAGLLDNLDAAVSTRSVYAGADTGGTTTLLGRLTALRAAALDNLDVATSTRLAGATYVAPDNAGIGVAATAAAAGATDAAAIKLKTDSLAFTVLGKLDANVHAVNNVPVNGLGSVISPWGP